MTENPQLPEPEIPDTYDFSGAPWMNIRPGQGEHLRRLAESVEHTLNRLYATAVERRRKDRNGEEAEELDEELVNFMMDDVANALEDFTEELEEAREIEREIGEDEFFGEGSHTDYHLDQDAEREMEQEFLDNYRMAESAYRSILQKFDREIDDMEMMDYLEARYDLNPLDTVDMPQPRMYGQ